MPPIEDSALDPRKDIHFQAGTAPDRKNCQPVRCGKERTFGANLRSPPRNYAKPIRQLAMSVDAQCRS